MKTQSKILPILVLFVILGCNSNSASNKSNLQSIKKDSIIEKTDTFVANIDDRFSTENILKFGDSIITYFRKKAGYPIKTYETTIDTFKTDKYEKITITVRTNTYRTNGLISYAIFTFPTMTEATDFFNDLKTQELIVPFGLSKRPNHILLDSNKVYWHHLEHGYGHRIKDLTRIFNIKFKFNPKSTNLDSVSGFTYCRCKNDDVSIDKIAGKWNTNSSIFIWDHITINPYYQNDCFEYFSEKDEITIDKDFITINGNKTPIKATSSIKLPDSRFFWKYYFQEDYFDTLSSEFNLKLNKLKISKERLTLYDIKITNHCSISVIALEKGKVYMVVKDKFFTLSKP